jgi:hypothetical protein
MRNLLKIPRRFAAVNGGKYSGSGGVILPEPVPWLPGGKREAVYRRFVDPTLRNEREGWGTRGFVALSSGEQQNPSAAAERSGGGGLC